MSPVIVASSARSGIFRLHDACRVCVECMQYIISRGSELITLFLDI